MSDSVQTPGRSGGDTPPDRQGLASRTNDIEEAYEYFLGYAAQGLPAQSGAGQQIREYLKKFESALAGLGPFFTDYIASLNLDVPAYQPFIDVIDRDARDAEAAIQLVLAQPAIGSQTIDNLNANIHVRALLTDLFLIDEILQAHA